jgi:hypothetical protein
MFLRAAASRAPVCAGSTRSTDPGGEPRERNRPIVMSNLNYNWISYCKICSRNHLENHVGKSQRTNTKMVAAREDRETVNNLFVCHRADNSRRRLRRRSDANGCNGDNKPLCLKNLSGLLMGHKLGCLLMMPLEIGIFVG